MFPDSAGFWAPAHLQRKSAGVWIRVRLEGIQTGDIVEVDRNGRRFHAIVTGSVSGGLAVQPTDRRVNYYTARSREVVGHWAKRGRPRATTEPVKPSPRQLEMDLL